jgi:hypothetical protein
LGYFSPADLNCGEAQNSGWNFGTSEAYLKDQVRYWLTEYDWRRQKSFLNKYPQSIADVNGVKIHFQYIRGKGKNASPLY